MRTGLRWSIRTGLKSNKIFRISHQFKTTTVHGDISLPFYSELPAPLLGLAVFSRVQRVAPYDSQIGKLPLGHEQEYVLVRSTPKDY